MALRDSTVNSGTSTTPNVTVPTGSASGDIAILVASGDDTAWVFADAVFPLGFIRLVDAGLTLDGHRIGIAWKRLTAADSGSYTFTAPGASADWVVACATFNGRDPLYPPMISADALNNAANASPVSILPNRLSLFALDDVLWIACPDVNAAGVATGISVPSFFTEIEELEIDWVTINLGVKENVATDGSSGDQTGTLTLSGSASGWGAWMIRMPGIPTPAAWGNQRKNTRTMLQQRNRQRY